MIKMKNQHSKEFRSYICKFILCLSALFIVCSSSILAQNEAQSIWAVGLNVGLAERTALTTTRTDGSDIIQYLNSAIPFANSVPCIPSESISTLITNIRNSNSSDARYRLVLNYRIELGTMVQSCTCSSGVARSSSFEQGVNRLGSDYRDFAIANNPRVCQQACEDDERCRAWTFVRPGVQGNSAMCWLKNSVPPPTNDSCCVSGMIGASN